MWAAATVAPATTSMWIVPAWAQWVGFFAVLATLIGLHLREQRQPGAPLRTYLEAIRRVRKPPRRQRRRITVITVAVVLLYAVVVIAHSITHPPTP